MKRCEVKGIVCVIVRVCACSYGVGKASVIVELLRSGKTRRKTARLPIRNSLLGIQRGFLDMRVFPSYPDSVCHGYGGNGVCVDGRFQPGPNGVGIFVKTVHPGGPLAV